MTTTVGARLRNVRVHVPTDRDRRLERAVALAAVGIPTLGAIAALASAFVFGLTRVEIALWLVGHGLTGFGISIGYHRLLSHRSFETTRFTTALFVILGSMCAQGPALWWAAIHRRHHATSDAEGDPHSPYVKDERTLGPWRGFWHGHMGWLFVHEHTSWMHYVPELLKDRLVFRLNQLYFVWIALGLAIPAGIGFTIHGTAEGAWMGFLWGGLLRVFTVQQATWCINSVCHVFGSRPFDCADQARNNLLVVLPTMGEGWHNHHHTFPRTASNQFEWWQIDPSGMLIRLLEKAGLAWDVSFPRREQRERYRRELAARHALRESR